MTTWSGFNQAPIFSSPEIKVGNGKVSFTGHATTIYSVDQAIEVLDWIGAKMDSEDCLAFAATLVENGELISIAEDNGEFGAGELLSEALNGLDGFNALVCVSRKCTGMFPSDMVQAQKLRCIRAAGVTALELLYDHLKPSSASAAAGLAGGLQEDGGGVRAEGRVELKPKRISLEPPNFSFSDLQQEHCSEKKKKK